MKQKWVLFVIVVMLILSCGTGPQPTEPVPPAEVAQPVAAPVEDVSRPAEPLPQEKTVPEVSAPPPPEEKGFDPGTISKEAYDNTKFEIQHLIEDLNKIIRARNYNSWLTYLSEDYRREINSKEFRDDLVEKFPAFRGRINNARDYFTNVVVPSRANDHVDDIEFVSENRVKAYTIFITRDNQRQRVILYNLELIDGKWQIIN